MRRLLLITFTTLLVVVLALSNISQKASASISQRMNSLPGQINLRATYGLDPLTEDAIIDSSAQWTAETMAANGVCAHLASQGYPGVRDRLVNFGYGGGSTVWATENMACGTSLDINAIAGYWADADHMRPAVDASYQDVGAGVATGSNGWTYVVLQAAYTEGGGTTRKTSVPPIQPRMPRKALVNG
jgi:uncharacterized protein YkwD